MKKLLLLFVMMVLPFMASAHGIEVKNADGVTIYYNSTNDGTELEVTFYGSSYDLLSDRYRGIVVIPEEVTYMNTTRKVTSIGKEAFRGCTRLTSVTIPNSVTSIGDGAFEDCSGLTSITIGNSVTSIGDYAFYFCSGLTSVTIGNSVTSIGEYAFYKCSGLTSIIIPNSVLSIKKNAFNKCRLQNVVAKNSKTSLSEAFSQGTLNHAILYIPVGKRWDFVYDGTWYLFANMKEMVTETNEINEQNAYMLMNAKSFEYMVYDEVNNEVRSIDSFYNVDENVASNNWQFVNIDGEKCLYNIKAKKYASISLDGKIQLQSLPTPLYMTNGNSGIIVNGNDEVQYNFVVNEKMAIDQNPTGIQTLTTGKINRVNYYDLNGQKLTGEPTKKGIYINNGQKIIVK